MQLTLIHLVISVPFLLILEGFFSGSEIALLSANRISLSQKSKTGSKSATLALKLATHPERILSTTLLMTSLCVVLISGIITLYFAQFHNRHSEILSILVTSPLVVIFGELIPKTLYQRYSNRAAIWVAYPVTVAYWVFFPITSFLAAYTRRISTLTGPIEEILVGKKRTTRDELKSILGYGRKETELRSSEKSIIKRIFDFKDTEAKHALIPLVKVDAVEEGATVTEALNLFADHRHSRMPVYSERIDNIVGILEITSLVQATDLKQSIQHYMEPAKYVAETQALEDLIREMKVDHHEMVVVVDEYGGAVGILTFEDIVEEIVGEIQDEYDNEHAVYKAIDENTWIIQSRAEVSQINEFLKLEIPEGDYETLGGFLLQQFGRIPQTGDELFFEVPKGTLHITVRKANARQIEIVKIEIVK